VNLLRLFAITTLSRNDQYLINLTTRENFMRATMVIITCLGLALGSTAIADTKSADKAAERAENVNETVQNFKDAQEARPYFDKSYGYAVFPTIGKGAIGVGAAGGKGHVYEQGRFVGESTMVQLSVGAQLGGQAYSQIVFFENKAAFDEFTREGFEFSADASAVALTAGASAEAGTKGVSAGASTTKDHGVAVAKYNKGMAVLTLAKGGLMYQAALAGQKYSFKSAAELQAKK
jgi:lipid-binding SYLF domain-containing protein